MRTAAAALLAIGVAAVGLTGCTPGPKPEPVAEAYLRAWSAGDLAGAGRLTDDPTVAQAELLAARRALGATAIRTARQKVDTNGDRATAGYTARWSVPGLSGAWSYAGRLSLLRSKRGWLVHWQASDIHPRLAPGQHLSLSRSLPPRAALLDRAGRPLFIQTDVVTIGVQPGRVRSLPSLAAALAAALRIDPAPITADVTRAKPTDFVPVITLRAADYAAVRAAVHDLPGTVFRTGQRVLAATPGFAQPLLGRVGDASAEVLAEAGPSYRAGDQLGISGLQRALNGQLSGTATGVVSALTAGRPASTLATITGRAGRPVRLTLDRGVQQTADSALSGVRLPAAIVALRPSTGELLAVANSATAPFDIALGGRYPAGSTFKIVTASAGLAGGLVSAASTVACPGTVRIGGRTIPNEDRFALGAVPLRSAFAHSCNTTFAALGDRIDPAAFRRTAAAFGIGAGWRLPVPAFSGSVPAPTGEVERAFDAIGQGRVLVSPLAEALMTATVAHGSVPVPRLVVGQPATPPTPGTPATPATPPTTAPSAPPLPAAVIATLRDFTRAVVTQGTATALAAVPGGPVAGKTGTAEFGTTAPPSAHSWFTGYQGDLAFSVFVYGGQTSGVLANPVARDFLTRLPR